MGVREVRTRTVFSDPELGDLTLDRLTRDISIFQRAKGHRFSSDDVVTAYVAARVAPGATRVLDLGCGIGSVLLHLAWTLPRASLVGIEAQEVSYRLLTRNIAQNDLSTRVHAHHGDLREATVAKYGGGFDLVTGTPPYFPPSSALDAEDEQRAYARIEYRGGIDDYVRAAARFVSEDGVVVLCGDSRTDGRVAEAAHETGLFLFERCDVISKAGQAPLFSVWCLSRHARPLSHPTMTLRTEHGETTDDAKRLRRFSGLESGPSSSPPVD